MTSGNSNIASRINTYRMPILIATAALTSVLPASFAQAVVLPYSNSANINVLRQSGVAGNFLVPHSNTVAGTVGINRDAPNDGSQWNTETDGGFDSGTDVITQTFTLGSPTEGGPNYFGTTSTVGSFRAEWDGNNRAPASFKLEGSLDGVNFFEFGGPGASTYTSIAGDLSLNFVTPLATKYIRYTATGPAVAGNVFGIAELQVFLQTGQTVPRNHGYDFLRDAAASGQVTHSVSPNTAIWDAPNGGNAQTMDDGLLNGNELKAQPPGGAGDRAYALYQLAAPNQIDFANFGTSKGQAWGNWEMYTSNSAASVTALGTITDNTIADLTGAGWTLQKSFIADVGGSGGEFFAINSPGEWQNVLLVWNEQFRGARQLELIAVPEPGSLALLALGGLWLVRRRRLSAR